MNLILSLLRLSLTNPTDAGRVLVDLRLTLGTAFSVFALVIIVAVLLMFGLSGFQGVMLLPGVAPLSPWSLTAIMGGGTLGLCVCIWLISRAFSQSGRFADGLLVFAYQMMLVLILGHVLVLSKPVSKAILKVTQFCKDTATSAAIVAATTMLVAFFNWGLGLIFGALLARKVAEHAQKNGIKLN